MTLLFACLVFIHLLLPILLGWYLAHLRVEHRKLRAQNGRYNKNCAVISVKDNGGLDQDGHLWRWHMLSASGSMLKGKSTGFEDGIDMGWVIKIIKKKSKYPHPQVAVKMRLPSTNFRKATDRVCLRKKGQQFSSGHVKFYMSIRNPKGNVK